MDEATESVIEATQAAVEEVMTSTPAASIWERLPKISLPTININIPLVLGMVFFFALFFLLWITIVYYVFDDMEQRPMDPNIKKLIIILTVGFNFIGFLLYIFIRPPTYEDLEQMDKEKELLELELRKLRKEMKAGGKSEKKS